MFLVVVVALLSACGSKRQRLVQRTEQCVSTSRMTGLSSGCSRMPALSVRTGHVRCMLAARILPAPHDSSPSLWSAPRWLLTGEHGPETHRRRRFIASCEASTHARRARPSRSCRGRRAVQAVRSFAGRVEVFADRHPSGATAGVHVELSASGGHRRKFKVCSACRPVTGPDCCARPRSWPR